MKPALSDTITPLPELVGYCQWPKFVKLREVEQSVNYQPKNPVGFFKVCYKQLLTFWCVLNFIQFICQLHAIWKWIFLTLRLDAIKLWGIFFGFHSIGYWISCYLSLGSSLAIAISQRPYIENISDQIGGYVPTASIF